MSAATMAAFRMMVREEIAVIEEAITNKARNNIQDIKEEFKQEKEASKYRSLFLIDTFLSHNVAR